MMKILIWTLIGTGIGAGLGYFGQCSSGTCPLTANWKRGAVVGAVLAALFCLGSGCAPGAAESSGDSAVVREIRQSEFESEVLNSPKPVVVDFYASWCGPCRILSPKLEKMAARFTNELTVVKVNVDKAKDLASRYEIAAIPAVKFFQGGRMVGGFIGLVSDDELETRFRDLAAKHPAHSTEGKPAEATNP